MPLSSKSSLTLSFHLFLCLPLLLSPLTCPCSVAIVSLFPSILSTCPNHVSHLLIFPITVSSAHSSSLVLSFLILSLLLLPLILLKHATSATSSFLSSSFFIVQHSDPYINNGSTNAHYSFILVLNDMLFVLHMYLCMQGYKYVIQVLYACMYICVLCNYVCNVYLYKYACV